MKTHSTYSQMTLERFRPHRRPGWKRKLGCWLWTVVWMLAVWALLWCFFSAISGAKKGGDLIDGIDRSDRDVVTPRLMVSRSHGLALAGMGASDAVAITIVLIVIVGLLVRLWWGSVAEREEASTYSDESWDPYAGDKPVPFGLVDPLALGGNEIPPSEEMPEGLTRLDAAMIVHACGCEVGLICSLVQGAERSMSVEDYGDALKVAEMRLAQLRVTLWELRARFKPEEGTALTGVTSLTAEASTREGEG